MHQSLRRLVANTEVMTSATAAELDTPAVTAFGIRLTTRHGKAGELVQLLEFARLAAEAAVAHYVAEARYESLASGACFRLHDDARLDSAARDALLACAVATLSRFTWLDGSLQGLDAAA